jgi:hypothetical protein
MIVMAAVAHGAENLCKVLVLFELHVRLTDALLGSIGR